MSKNEEETQILEEIIKHTGLEHDEIEEEIQKKMNEFKGLVSRGVAITMIYDDLGLNTPKKNTQKKSVKKEVSEKKEKKSNLKEIEKSMALTVRDENEAIEITTPTLPKLIYPSTDELLFLMERRDWLKANLINADDKMKIGNQIFLKKSAWRKYINAFGISIEIINERVYEKDGDTIAEYRVKAITPTGQYSIADGTKSKSEYWSDKYQNYGNYTLHALKATARTRAINIAVSDLVGYGETSAEELPGQE